MSVLVARDLSVRFGGLVAVDGFGFEAPVGAITGLVGPNGAGKTTTFNACFGTVPSTGTLTLDGIALHGLSTPARARCGLARTFQRTRLYDSLTVRENVAMGLEAAQAGSNPWRYLTATKRQRSDVRAAAGGAIHRCRIGHLADAPAGSLTLGQRRLVELARAMAQPAKMLFLDEPASGLDANETEALSTLLTEIVADGRRGIVLVEHDMSLVSAICTRVYVLQFGTGIFEGDVAAMHRDPQVKAAYLGTPP